MYEKVSLLEAERDQLRKEGLERFESACAQLNEMEQQISDLEKQIEIQEKNQQGIQFFQIGEFAKALEVFQEVLVLDPQNETALDYERRSKIETISKETTMSAEAEKQYLKGMDEYLKGNLNEAIRIWEEILIQEPYNKKVLTAIQGAQEKRDRNGN